MEPTTGRKGLSGIPMINKLVRDRAKRERANPPTRFGPRGPVGGLGLLARDYKTVNVGGSGGFDPRARERSLGKGVLPFPKKRLPSTWPSRKVTPARAGRTFPPCENLARPRTGEF